MARPKKRRSRKKAAPPPPPSPPTPPPPEPEPFPFMTLPPEIRLMVYDSLMPKTVRFDGRGDYPMLRSAIRSLMRVKTIRAELLPHIFTRYHFEWIYTFKHFRVHPRWFRFKQRAIPFINSFTFEIQRPYLRPRDPTDLFSTLLNWMRWRSLRSHLYPWHLKKLTLKIKPKTRVPVRLHQRYLPTSPGNDSFLRDAPIVPGLEFLTIVLSGRVCEEAAKAFLQRWASCGVQGRIGYWYHDGRKARYLAHVLQEGQLVSSRHYP